MAAFAGVKAGIRRENGLIKFSWLFSGHIKTTKTQRPQRRDNFVFFVSLW